MIEKTQTTPYTAEQREHLKQRTRHDAELLDRGAEYDENGRLELTQHMIGRLAEELARTQLETFKETAEGKQIAAHGNMLGNLRAALGGNLGYAVPLRPDFHKLGPSALEVETYRAWSKDNGLDLDFDHLKHEDEADLKQAIKVTEAASAELWHLTNELIQYPQFGLGHEVTVERNGKEGKPAYKEHGWKVDTILGNGNLRVVSNDETLRKDVTIDSLEAWAAN